MILKIKEYIKLMRIKHYIKNILIFLPMFFSGKIFETSLYKMVIFGFISFCLLSSIIYILNDIHDLEDDKNHPIKKNRPLASGKIKVYNAILLAIALTIIIIVINILFIKNVNSYIYLIIYFILNVLYSYKLKTVQIIDVIILSFGFLLRVLYGGCILNIPVSNWLFLTILSGALFMAMGKRRNELKKNGSTSRKVLQYYSSDFLNKNMYMFLGITLVFFSLWVFEQNVEYYVWCIPILFIICLRYSFNIESDQSYGDPVDVIFSDKLLMLFITLLAIIMILFIYII